LPGISPLMGTGGACSSTLARTSSCSAVSMLLRRRFWRHRFPVSTVKPALWAPLVSSAPGFAVGTLHCGGCERCQTLLLPGWELCGQHSDLLLVGVGASSSVVRLRQPQIASTVDLFLVRCCAGRKAAVDFVGTVGGLPSLGWRSGSVPCSKGICCTVETEVSSD
jgi:hypothetical protein